MRCLRLLLACVSLVLDLGWGWARTVVFFPGGSAFKFRLSDFDVVSMVLACSVCSFFFILLVAGGGFFYLGPWHCCTCFLLLCMCD